MNSEEWLRVLAQRYYVSAHNNSASAEDVSPFKPAQPKAPDEILPSLPTPPSLDFSNRNPRIDARYIPGVDLRYEDTFYWRKAGMGYEHGYASTYTMLGDGDPPHKARERFVEACKARKMILCGVMEDRLQCTNTVQEHIRLGKEAGAWGITTVERSIYTDTLHHESVRRLLEYLASFKLYYDSGLNIIPYIIGADRLEIDACCHFFKKWGITNVAYDATGPVKRGRRSALKHLISHLRHQFSHVTVSNLCSFQLCYLGVSFMSPTWFKVPKEAGCLVRCPATRLEDTVVEKRTPIEELMYRSLEDTRISFEMMTAQKRLTDFEFVKDESVLVNAYGKNSWRK